MPIALTVPYALTMEQAILRLGDGPVHYRRAGESDRALMLLHGLASNGSRWNELVRTSSLTRDWTVLVPDLRGQALSVVREPIRSEDWVADLAAILDQEGFADCVIGGHCLGANVAARFALRFPERVRGLILVEPMLAETLSGGLGMLARARGLLGPLAGAVLVANRLGLWRRLLPRLDLEALDRETRRKMAEGRDRQALTRRYGSPLHDLRYVPVASYLQSLRETLRPMPPWDRLQAPTLVLLSSGNRFGDCGRAQSLLRAIPRHSIAVVEAEHWIHAEEPEALRLHIEHWLATLETAAPAD
ncbi:alpha/beta fold hydrolase [Thioalkalivibrio paradoxus]|uniref:alpha/beta fold hydrolase n=1 Tax=Thioalkalivibrio paradoxus TaxID=108010 RepID=UPI00022C092A|nr:alpha/beta hydrolase [Thioalkalivibrio paradoxus]